MRANNFGRIVLVSSSSAFQPLAQFATYGASNAGLLGFGQALATELKGSGVHVLTVCPGGMDTNFQSSANVCRRDGEQLLAPDDVADEIMTALRRRRVVQVVGSRAKAMDVMSRVLPRPAQRALWSRLVDSMR